MRPCRSRWRWSGRGPQMPRRSDDTPRHVAMLRPSGSLRPKGGTSMTVAELKRKLRNSPFTPLQVRITGA